MLVLRGGVLLFLLIVFFCQTRPLKFSNMNKVYTKLHDKKRQKDWGGWPDPRPGVLDLANKRPGQQCFGPVMWEMASWEGLGFCFFCPLLPGPPNQASGLPRPLDKLPHNPAHCPLVFLCATLDSSLHLFVSHVDPTTATTQPFLVFFLLDPRLFLGSSVSCVLKSFSAFCWLRLWSPSQKNS